MIEVDKNNILSITRGDTFQIPLFINKGTDMDPLRYVLKDNDEIYLAVMQPNQCFETAILKKKFTKANLNKFNDVLIRFEHDDTVCLLPGSYFYQIKGKIENEYGGFDVVTIIQKTELSILE